ncbi:hypothetical protein BKA93DRAFT_192402 [Sparassis latifolia]
MFWKTFRLPSILAKLRNVESLIVDDTYQVIVPEYSEDSDSRDTCTLPTLFPKVKSIRLVPLATTSQQMKHVLSFLGSFRSLSSIVVECGIDLWYQIKDSPSLPLSEDEREPITITSSHLRTSIHSGIIVSLLLSKLFVPRLRMLRLEGIHPQHMAIVSAASRYL